LRGKVDAAALARILYLSAGVMRWRDLGGMRVPFRAAACTGNLHHIDAYVVCAHVAGLEAGVYHFGPQDFALRRLRRGDFRGNLCAAAAAPEELRDAPVWLVFTSTFWRNAWKYRERTYRHAFWDCGTILANLLAAAASAGIRHRILTGFVDDDVNRLIGVDGRREAAIALVALGSGVAPPAQPEKTPPLELAVEPYSPRETEYAEIVAMHRASALSNADEVRAWRSGARRLSARTIAATTSLPMVQELPPAPIEDVVAKRGSTRQFAREPIAADVFGAILRAACTRIPADFQVQAALTNAYVIAHAVHGLEPGTYASSSDGSRLLLLAKGNFRHEAGALALGQALAADAAANVYMLADLHTILPALGNRGYRAAQLEGGIAGGKIYLAAFALGIGATGLTFFDDDVTAFFSPHAAGRSVMFLTAVGKPAKRRRR
jgi:SagB-type dehydrogenase family enzyme